MKILKITFKSALTILIPLLLALIIATIKVKLNLQQYIEVAKIFGENPINAKLSFQFHSQWYANRCVGYVLFIILMMIWSKRQSVLYRFLYFIPFLMLSIILNNAYNLKVFSIIPVIVFTYLYNILLNKNYILIGIKKMIPFLSGNYLHHLGIQRICIVLGCICMFLTCIWHFNQLYVNGKDILLILMFSTVGYFLPFIIAKLYLAVFCKIYLWIKAGFNGAD